MELSPGRHTVAVSTVRVRTTAVRERTTELESEPATCRRERWRASVEGAGRVVLERARDRFEPCERQLVVERERSVPHADRRRACGAELQRDFAAGERYVLVYSSEDPQMCTLLCQRETPSGLAPCPPTPVDHRQ